MNLKMETCILGTLLFGFISIFFCKYLNSISIPIVIGFTTIIVLTIMSKIFLKYHSIKKYKIIYIILSGIMFVSSCIYSLYNGNNYFLSGVYSFFIVLSFMLTCLVNRTKYNGSMISIFVSFVLYIMFILLGFENTILSVISIFLLPFMLYILGGFDLSSFFRKRNIIRLLLFFLCLLFLISINPIMLLFGLIPVYYLYERYDTNLKIFLIACYLLSSIIGVVLSFLYNIEIIIDVPIFYYFYSCFVLTILFIIIDKTYKYEIGSLLVLYNFVSLIGVLTGNTTILYIVVPVSFIITGFLLEKINVTKFRFNKYFVPKNIRKVSVVIPNYNYAHYIEERIDSILNQKYPIYELIILDDKSTDNSIEVINKKISSIKDTHPDLTVKFIPNKVNSGNVFKQWEKCFECASGDYLWICEADDLCSKYFLNTVMQGFENQDVVLSYAESTAIDENGNKYKNDLRDWIDIYNCHKWEENYIKDGKEELKETLCINNTIPNASGVVFKIDRDIPVKKYLNVSQKFALCGDWYFYSKYLLHGSIAYDLSSLNYHRMHKNGVTLSTDNFVHYKEILTVQESIKKDVKIPKESEKLVNDRLKRLRQNMCINDEELKYDKIDLKQLIKEKKIKDEYLLSIIIPVYNVEKYLNKCLKSVFIDLPIKTEVIIINDGSPDNSEEIIKDFQKKHKEIVYIKKENGGLSSVKNVGLKKARGKYVIFLDSDDYVSSNMYNTMLKKIIKEDADLVYSDVMMVYEDGTIKYISMKNYDYNDILMQILDGNLMAASWNKIVKKELYDGLIFPEGYNNEDISVSPVLFLRAKSIKHIQSPFYKYLQRTGSIQNSGFNEKRLVVFDTAKICFERIKEYSINKRKKVEGTIVTNQILALLIWPIAEINNKEERLKLISLFCEKFNELQFDRENPIIFDYLKKYSKKVLLDYINNNDINGIDRIIKR